ncbi:2-hydroxychromene-2-carboxylate isomerase [Roseateles saccharophilus]|uniref:2-hydroxychromene-2-carboxylate isomerase n=1 Tax=Roseateles saccharophilus TaxID=304 RepID=A0A4R3UDV0_ROSSA|nr:2-hydroxychromene-2-carboxylate isomerase [Roseateles saccharophilus]MDG0835449.1 2-hydroxychromene-2-carboxylate isomerase [Roseateles saccharophilus]TCU86338.1 2-hydroxychromene-2-carboxylate isomerase [Roseateles saccharophilus]
MIDDRFLADNTALQRAPVQFYFDFSSPYSYIASEWIEAVAARHGRRVQWHAILLGATFQAAELKSPVSYPIKRDYALRDFERSARFAGLPYRQPETFPIPTQNAARVFWWLHGQDPARAVAWAHAGLRAYFTRGVALDDAGALKALLAESGIDADAAEAAWSEPAWKARLKAENDAAIAAGVFGAPYFIVDGEPFWGNDRQAQIEGWLASGPFKGLI